MVRLSLRENMMINFSEILKNRRSEELPELKNPENRSDAFASLFAESVKNASDALTNTAEKISQDKYTEKSTLEAKDGLIEEDEAIDTEKNPNNEVKEFNSEGKKAIAAKQDKETLPDEAVTVKMSKSEKNKDVIKKTKTDEVNKTADSFSDTIKTANNVLLSIINKSTIAKPEESKTNSSDMMKTGAKAANVLTRNIHNNKSEINTFLSENKISDKNEKLISDFLKDKKFILKERIKESPDKNPHSKDSDLNELESKQKIRVSNKTDHVKTVKAAENSAISEISKKNDINQNIKITDEIQTGSNISSANKKETSDGNFFSFDKNTSNIRNDRELKAEINTAAKTPFADQLKDIINNSRINVRNDKNADITIKMNPENLGDMRVKMEMENGIIKANFTVATEEAKELLLQNIEELKNSLSSGGISIGEMKVSVKNENNGENRNFIPEKNIIPDVKESTAVYSADALQYDGHLNLIV